METTNELAVIVNNSGLVEDERISLLKKFNDKYTEAKALVDASKTVTVTSEDQKDAMKEARQKRLDIAKVRTSTENLRKAEKAQALLVGQTIDHMARKIKEICDPAEAHLETQEKFAELRAAERKATRFAERVEELAPYVEDTTVFNLNDMEDKAFETLLETSKTAHEAQKAAEAKAEADRVAQAQADAAEQERIRLENIELRKAADKRETELAAERKEAADALAAVQAKVAAAEAEIAANKAVESEQQAATDEAKRQALLAPDKDKLTTLADVIDALVMPNVASREAGVVLDETKDFLARISKNLRQKASAL